MRLKFKEITVLGARQVFDNRKLIILFWVTNAILAFILSLPLYNLLSQHLNHSLTSNLLNSQFDFLWLVQFQNIYAVSLSEIPFMIYSVVGVYALIQTFYFGGLVSIFKYPQKNHISDFFYGGVKYWADYFKVLLITLIAFAVLFLVNDLIVELISSIFADSNNYIFEFTALILHYVFLLFCIGIITIVSDYSKVSIAVHDDSNVLRRIIDTIKFIKNNFIVTFSIFLFIAILGAIGSISYNIFEMLIPRTPYYLLILAFVLQQLLVIFRLIIRIYFCSTEVLVYKDLSAKTIKMKEKLDLEVI